jgi:hypothetical protein
MYHINYKQPSGIGALLNTENKNPLWAHKAKILPLGPSRLAFLGLIRLNVWGIASLIKQQAFFIDQATTDASAMGQYYWDVYKRWDVGWYNLGGDSSSLFSAVNAGANKKPLGIKLAPKDLRKKLEEKGISGLEPQGIGVTLEAAIVSASLIITPLVPLIIMLVNNKRLSKMEAAAVAEADRQRAEADKQRAEAARNRAFELERQRLDNEAKGSGSGDSFSFTDADGKVTTAGYGIIGAAVLGMLFLGTMKKNKSKK